MDDHNKSELRKRAEELMLRQEQIHTKWDRDNVNALIHDLNVHQIELEIQNQELRESQLRLEKAKQVQESALARFEALFNSAPEGFILIDVSGMVLECNHTTLEMLGCKREDLIRKPFSAFVHIEDQPKFYASYPSFFKSTYPKPIEIRLIHKGSAFKHKDHSFIAELTGCSTLKQDLFKDLYHDNPFILVSIYNINAHKLLERELADAKQAAELANHALLESHDKLEATVAQRTAALKTSNEQLKQQMIEREQAQHRLRLTAGVFENTSEAIIITDAANRVMEVNPAFVRITGYPADEVIGRDPGFMKSHRHTHEFYAEMWKKIWQTGQWQGEIWDRRHNGEIYPKWLTINAVYDERGHLVNCIGIFSDISRLKATEERLEQLAFFDCLTKLPNRAHFQSRLDHALTAANRRQNKVGLIFIDLDHFKHINDSMGHNAGDQLLIEAAKRIQSCVREEDTVARMGGDEFTIILADLTDTAKVMTNVALTILESFTHPIVLEDKKLFIGCSLGMAIYPDDSGNAALLIKHADTAMYRAKESGRNRYSFYTAEMNAQAQSRISLESELRYAIDHKAFELYYQPKVDAHSSEIVGFEALLRWIHPTEGVISPNQFIPIAEESGLIAAIGNQVVEMACQGLQRINRCTPKPLPVAINLSVRQLRQDNLVNYFSQTLANYGIEAEQLELEVTESFLAKPIEKSAALLQALHQLGYKIAIDDFGTGYSSLSYLKNFPIHTLKIDRSFVMEVAHNQESRTIVQAIISMAHALGYDLVAEGVETAAQVNVLQGLGCGIMQGFHYARPAPLHEILEILSLGSTLAIQAASSLKNPKNTPNEFVSE
ncbi:diguanylate cyclase/phosphodiesterase with PAS/PAC sensor(s) [Magnetococcus marinus MC-1]|uniref:Diguanylate cyclase/phosphodiesterase with PAS/PAC sensor(S) n=1 Tax=Magnetococcus marinus (strain ATCC BAA-1437 / JCM 17883 / MC-1) TaxID=156889 RepID=A0LD38_MAGMM|nr:EAL domain-containing protein [Magnetococcus marinus]ABK45881.1 diguanylate cyclase/phosphodiesterase with PAS/PAC sensor(s) [Magnetococcus marinus MC-1]